MKRYLVILIIILIIGICFWMMTLLPKEIIPLIAAGFGFIVNKAYESNKESKEKIFEKKREAYLNLLRPWRDIFLNIIDKDNNFHELTKQEINKAREAAFDAMLYASDEVVKKYAAFRTIDYTKMTEPSLIVYYFGNLVLCIRKDLGYSDTKVDEFDFMITFLNLTEDEKLKYKQFVEKNKRNK